MAAGLQQPAGDQGEDQEAEEKRPGLQACPAEGFTVLQQCPTAGSPSSSQERRGGGRDTGVETLGPSWREEQEWNVEAQVLMPTQVS